MISLAARGWRKFAARRAEEGSGAAWRWFIDRLGVRLLNWTLSEVVWLDLDEAKFSGNPPAGFEFRFLTPQEVASFTSPEHELSERDAALAAGGRDRCFAALTNGRLAAYGWYALGSAEAIHCGGVPLSFPADVAYMYKGFTHPDFRGQRLHGFVMRLAIEAMARDCGVRKLISMVDWLNVASLKSCDRLGYRRLGRILKLGWPACSVSFPPAAAKALGVRFGRRADLSGRR
jgi:hypothetical protein